jgi:single-stranded DNA-specific DHH superfamily exonuclease
MATTLDALKGINAYPIPLRTLCEVADRRGLTLTAEATQDTLFSSDYRLAKADLLIWLSLAPDVSQGGQSFSFTDEQRKQLRAEANAIYDALEPTATAASVKYGYKGSRL